MFRFLKILGVAIGSTIAGFLGTVIFFHITGEDYPKPEFPYLIAALLGFLSILVSPRIIDTKESGNTKFSLLRFSSGPKLFRFWVIFFILSFIFGGWSYAEVFFTQIDGEITEVKDVSISYKRGASTEYHSKYYISVGGTGTIEVSTELFKFCQSRKWMKKPLYSFRYFVDGKAVYNLFFDYLPGILIASLVLALIINDRCFPEDSSFEKGFFETSLISIITTILRFRDGPTKTEPWQPFKPMNVNLNPATKPRLPFKPGSFFLNPEEEKIGVLIQHIRSGNKLEELSEEATLHGADYQLNLLLYKLLRTDDPRMDSLFKENLLNLIRDRLEPESPFFNDLILAFRREVNPDSRRRIVRAIRKIGGSAATKFLQQVVEQ